MTSVISILSPTKFKSCSAVISSSILSVERVKPFVEKLYCIIFLFFKVCYLIISFTIIARVWCLYSANTVILLIQTRIEPADIHSDKPVSDSLCLCRFKEIIVIFSRLLDIKSISLMALSSIDEIHRRFISFCNLPDYIQV